MTKRNCSRLKVGIERPFKSLIHIRALGAGRRIFLTENNVVNFEPALSARIELSMLSTLHVGCKLMKT